MVTRIVLIDRHHSWSSRPRGPGTTQEIDYVRKDTRDASRQATLAQYMPAMQWTGWHLVGPFDNTNMDRHDVVYPAGGLGRSRRDLHRQGRRRDPLAGSAALGLGADQPEAVRRR